MILIPQFAGCKGNIFFNTQIKLHGKFRVNALKSVTHIL
jgi:hypothetical protein